MFRRALVFGDRDGVPLDTEHRRKRMEMFVTSLANTLYPDGVNRYTATIFISKWELKRWDMIEVDLLSRVLAQAFSEGLIDDWNFSIRFAPTDKPSMLEKIQLTMTKIQKTTRALSDEPVSDFKPLS